MRQLLMGFYGEGIIDYQFLKPIVERTLERLLPYVDTFVLDIVIAQPSLNDEAKMSYVLDQSKGYDGLFYHLDADKSTEDMAYQRLKHAYDAATNGELLPQKVVPIIPIRMTDAWMLVDFDAFQQWVSTKLDPLELGFPKNAAAVEHILAPKEVFREALRKVQRQRRPISPPEVYVPLAESIALERLDQVPAYNNFKARLRHFLIESNHLTE